MFHAANNGVNERRSQTSRPVQNEDTLVIPGQPFPLWHGESDRTPSLKMLAMPIDQDLELDLLRTFIAVAATGSFTAAAPIVGRPQSAEPRVLRIEKISGETVFSRASRSLHLTFVGENLLAFSRNVVEQNDQLVSSIRGSQAVTAFAAWHCRESRACAPDTTHCHVSYS
jgi:hypothetical protein